MEYDSAGFSAWVRYTKGSLSLNQTDRIYGQYPSGFNLPAIPVTVAYDQLTGFVGNKFTVNDALSLDVSSSFGFTDYERIDWHPEILDNHQEQTWISKAQLNWQPFKGNQLAFGTEFDYLWLGLPSWLSSSPPVFQAFPNGPQTWQSDMLSFFGEDQWQIIPKWTLFLSGRADKDRFTEWLFSPRAALAWAPENKDTFKFIASQSLRTNTEEYMYAQWLSSHTYSAPENMTSLELRWERQQTDHLFFGTSVYYNRLGVIGWNQNASEEQNLGSYKTAGIEVEASYRTPTDTITLSHGYTKLIGQNFNPNSGTFITSAPFGYGYDLASWADNDTKLTVHHKFSEQFSADANIQVLWGFPGGQAYQDYKNSMPYFGAGTPTDTVAGYTQPYGPSAFLSLGVEYNITPHATLRFDAYNVLGWFDQTLNKDIVTGGLWSGEYRVEAPAYALTLKYEF